MTDAKKQHDTQAQDGRKDLLAPSEIDDAELDVVAGGLMSTAGASSGDTAVCISKSG